MRVLLLYPNTYGMNMIPPALGIFTAVLKQAGHELQLFDTTDYVEEYRNFDKEKSENLNARPINDFSKLEEAMIFSSPIEDFNSLVNSFKPNLIAVSCVEDMFPRAIELLSSLNGIRPYVVMGGVFPTFAADVAYDNSNGGVDYILKGEGEKTILELCDKLEKNESVADIDGMYYVEKNVFSGDKVINNSLPSPNPIADIPIPDYSLFQESRFYRPMHGKVRRMFPIETFRGCPYKCTYCNSPSQTTIYKDETNVSFFRKAEISRIEHEIETMINVYKADSLYFWADTFLSWNKKDFYKFCDMYEKYKLPFWIQTRPETIKKEYFEKLKELGLLRVSFGIEHGSEWFREKYLERKLKNSKIIEKLKIVTDMKIPISVNNIMGFPFETRELAFDTIELNRQIESDGLNAYTFVPFHGVPLRKVSEDNNFVKKGKIVRSVMYLTMLDQPQFSKEEIEGIRRCFVLYVKMPKDRWNDIKKAESLTPEGDKILLSLKEECAEKYMNYGDHDSTEGVDMVNFEK
jgi:anaerobic magnesium-protoporphyrin IX monomethyl ester cyclase